MDLAEIEWDGLGWISVAKDKKKWRALMNAVMNLLVA
jgi:hypothetical protein